MNNLSHDTKRRLLILLVGELKPTDLDPFLQNHESSSSLEEVIAAAGGSVCKHEREKRQELEKQNESLISARRDWELEDIIKRQKYASWCGSP